MSDPPARGRGHAPQVDKRVGELCNHVVRGIVHVAKVDVHAGQMSAQRPTRARDWPRGVDTKARQMYANVMG